ncbi:MAG: hypothetical protein R2826_01250 [Thermoleophilia bacterium]
MNVVRDTDWQLDLDVDDVLRGQGADPQEMRRRNQRLVERAQAALVEAAPLLHPVVLSVTHDIAAHADDHIVLSSGARFTCGPWAAARLAPATRLVTAVCTVGESLEIEVNRRFPSDPVSGLALDGVGSAAIDRLAARACRRFQRQARTVGLRGAIHCWPGSTQWPTEAAQPEIFALVDPDEVFTDTVRLLPSFVMRPLKSLTLVLGLTSHPVPAEHECDICAVRATCRHRRAEA